MVQSPEREVGLFGLGERFDKHLGISFQSSNVTVANAKTAY